MSYSVRLLAGAQRDLSDIEDYFAEHVPHETVRCLDSIEAALRWIAEHAHQPRASRFGLRHVSAKRFPYHAWYRVFEKEKLVQVIAVLHHRRGDDALGQRVI